jgi:undecaprenyl diphosphate synthase
VPFWFCLQVYAFSVENWQRDEAEVVFLMNLFKSSLQQQLSELQDNGVQLHFMGDLQRLPASLQQQMAASEVATADNDQLMLTVAVSYGAQQDMTQAVQQLAKLVQAGQLAPEQVSSRRPPEDQQVLSRHHVAAAVLRLLPVGPSKHLTCCLFAVGRLLQQLL